jgi:hypothetical protein
MEQQQLAAYLQLIQELLSCPQGEEWIQLKRHEALVDAQLIEVMEQVAAQLHQQGNSEAAIFLKNWAAKLHHIFFKEIAPPASQEDISEAYLTLIQRLLSCPEGLEDDLIAEHKSLIGPGLVHEMREVARQLRDQDEIAMAITLEKMASHLNQMWMREHNFSSDFQKARSDKAIAPPTPPENQEPKEPDDAIASTVATTATPFEPPDADSSQWLDDDIDDLWNSAASYPQTDLQSDLQSDSKPNSPPVVAVESAEAVPPQPTVLEPDVYQAIAASLQAIAEALQRSGDPLGHLEALERACEAEWQLTTGEVEQLIGTKPRCNRKEEVYQRGNWCFTKVAHIGTQTAWQVSKCSNTGPSLT